MIKGYQYQSDFARKYYGQGRAEGEQKGRQEGKEEGLRTAVMALARAKLKTIPSTSSRRLQPSPTCRS